MNSTEYCANARSIAAIVSRSAVFRSTPRISAPSSGVTGWIDNALMLLLQSGEVFPSLRRTPFAVPVRDLAVYAFGERGADGGQRQPHFRAVDQALAVEPVFDRR